ncbi:DUF805 domain-containing protein [Asaia krungthepensis]|uniref:DUF805 domain-containing protein n=1 Tax=Asaia krungthepensis TaxID=220990 RepID=UPI0022304CDE|nr:DUF805 domain-containing protein [Asaia krungthepensis]
MFKRWNDFSGRSSRAEFWWAFLICILINLVCTIPNFLIGFVPAFLDAFHEASHTADTDPTNIAGFLGIMRTASTGLSFFLLIFSFAAFIPFVSLGIRRIHDTGHSGWWILVPYANLVFFLKRGDQASNSFGAPALDTESDYRLA